MTCWKTLSIAVTLTAAVGISVAQTTVTTDFNGVNKVIPDYPGAGVSDTHTLSFSDLTFNNITDLSVSLNLTNGFNGDFYAYLVHGSGFAVLLNRVGRTSDNSLGYGDSGFNVTFNESGLDIHDYQTVSYELDPISSQLTGDWAPDARTADPSVVLDTDPRSAYLHSFYGNDPNGDWTLFLADLDLGEQGTLVSWSLTITAIPEPATGALLGLAAAAFLWHRRARRAT